MSYNSFGKPARDVFEAVPSGLKATAYFRPSDNANINARLTRRAGSDQVAFSVAPKVTMSSPEFKVDVWAYAEFGKIPQFFFQQVRENLFFPGIRSTLKLASPSDGAAGKAVSGASATAEFTYEQKDGAVLDSLYSFGETATPKVVYAIGVPVLGGDLKVGGKATLTGGQKGFSALEVGATKGAFSLFLRDAIKSGVGAADAYVVSSAHHAFEGGNLTGAVELNSNRTGRIGLKQIVTPDLRLAYKFDFGSTRAGISSNYKVSPSVSVATGFDVSSQDTKDYKVGVSVTFD